MINKKIAIMGGTFDPIHIAHLVVAETVKDKFNMDKIIFIPSGIPPHKLDNEITCAKHRYNMVALAIADNNDFEVSKIEINRSGITYTIDTFYELKKIYGDKTDIYFITGADAIFNISTWFNYEKLLAIANFIVVDRPGFDKIMLRDKINNLNKAYNGNIILTEIPNINISSSMIRELVKNKNTVRYLVPEGVSDYIKTNALYQ